VRHLARALGIAVVFAWVAACGRPAGVPARQDLRAELTALWTQIRDWRREAHMDVEPERDAVLSMKDRSVRAAAAVCPATQPPPVCVDICDLADAICDNAESICDIAAQLGDDPWAKDKCDNAKASCREAKQRCCTCERDAPASAADGAREP
jgi:hypothetical protein